VQFIARATGKIIAQVIASAIYASMQLFSNSTSFHVIAY